MLADTHAHLFWDSYKKDIDLVLKRAEESEVKVILNVGVDLKTSKDALVQAMELSDSVKLYSSIAIHPEEAVKYFNNEENIEKDIAELEKIYKENPETVIAVGECGLDFAYFDKPDSLPEGLTFEHAKELQRVLFQSQIDLAKKLNLPLLVHCRDNRSENFNNSECWDEIITRTKDYKGIYHCYSGLLTTTQEILRNTNFLVSFAGNLTYPKNDYLKEAVNILPLERILLETDCPFLPPQSIRGKRNEPSSVKEIAQTIAIIKNIPAEKVAEVTTENFLKLFGLQN